MTGPPELEGVAHREVKAGGLRVHVAEAGSGDPVVLLHGWPQHWYEWRHVIPLLAGERRVICPDLRGFGWTDAPDGPVDAETFATDTVALLDGFAPHADDMELEILPGCGHFVADLEPALVAERARSFLDV